MTPDLADSALVRLVEGPRIAQLLVVVARAGLRVQEHFIDPLVQVRGGLGMGRVGGVGGVG